MHNETQGAASAPRTPARAGDADIAALSAAVEKEKARLHEEALLASRYFYARCREVGRLKWLTYRLVVGANTRRTTLRWQFQTPRWSSECERRAVRRDAEGNYRLTAFRKAETWLFDLIGEIEPELVRLRARADRLYAAQKALSAASTHAAGSMRALEGFRSYLAVQGQPD